MCTTVEKKVKMLEEKEIHWAEMEKRVEGNAIVAPNKITLDVGMQSYIK